MIEGLLSPPNVRTHEDYHDEMNFDKASEWVEELGEFENVVLMGVPGDETDNYTGIVNEILKEEAFEDADIYAHSEEGQGLDDFDYEEISYDSMPSRIADIEWMKDSIPEDEDVAVFSMDYNVRTGAEIDERLEGHETFGQYALDFDDFQDFSIKNYMKGRLPFTESFRDETTREKSFKYKTPETGESNALVMNIPFSEDIKDYDGKMRSEALRHGLAELPYGQKMKDIGKKGLSKVLGSFDY